MKLRGKIMNPTLKTRAEALYRRTIDTLNYGILARDRENSKLVAIYDIEQALIDTHNEAIEMAANKFKGDLMAGDAIADEILTLKVTK